MPHDLHHDPASRPQGLSAAGNVVTKRSFPADFRWVRRVIQETTETLCDRGMGLDDLGSVEIVLAEALNNIVEHAYPEGQPGEVHLYVRQGRAGLLVEIRDTGKPMPKGRAPIGNHPMAEFTNDPMPEGGYGWFLIRELVRDLIYDREDGENFLVFRMAISSPGSG